MAGPEQDFTARLMATFSIEAQEHIASILDGLLNLEKNPSQDVTHKILETIHRDAHSLKGAARAVNLSSVETICRYLEDIFSAWKQNKLTYSIIQFDVLHQVLDCITKIIGSGVNAETNTHHDLVLEISQQLSAILLGENPKVVVKKNKPETNVGAISIESVRISMPRLLELLLQAEEMITTKLLMSQRLSELGELEALLVQWQKEAEELEIKSDFFNEKKIQILKIKVRALIQSVTQDRYDLDLTVNNLLEGTKRMLMLPFSTLLNLFPKIVRDLGRDQNKMVDVTIEGGDVEIDKRILEEIKDPLIHIVRNAIDHGIESNEERKKTNKPERGTIKINILQQTASEIEVVVSDDGAGIDTATLKSVARARGDISSTDEALLSHEQSLALIYQSGLSTKSQVSDLSGHGLGMSIVKEKVEKLGGQVTIESQPQKGTTIYIKLPVTLATFKGILCQVEQQLFVIPTIHIDRALRVCLDDIKTVGNQATINLADQVIVLVSLAELLGLSPKTNTQQEKFVPLLVVHSGEKSIALKVDVILNEMEVLVKSLTGVASTSKPIAGATVLGSGQVVPIINIAELSKLVAVEGMTNSYSIKPVESVTPVVSKSILLVDDSITTRMLLKNILETAGFVVSTAVDGMDAWSKIKLEKYSLVVTDLEMPNMDGFALIKRIREDKKLASLPVVIISTRDAQEDKIRGMDVGADAYIVKKGLNDHDLLAVVQELI